MSSMDYPSDKLVIEWVSSIWKEEARSLLERVAGKVFFFKGTLVLSREEIDKATQRILGIVWMWSGVLSRVEVLVVQDNC